MISTLTRIPLEQLRPLDLSQVKPFRVDEAPEELYQQIIGAQQGMLEARHTKPADTASNPTYLPYATVQVGDVVVAEIDNHGFTTMANGVAARLGGTLPSSVNGQNGPVLAQARAEKIAETVGGKIVLASTALTQERYSAIPQPGSRPDDQAANQRLLKTEEARTLFQAQQGAQSSGEAVAATEAEETTSSSSAEQAFLDYMQKSPAERMREAILKDMGLTEEQVANLPPEERERIEQEIQERIEQRMARDAAEIGDRDRA